ncbi:diphthamide synthesis protein [Candidatus Pacearchaeota archaeon]|nr:diphthamide synthesis protein [Candidatus Pacearchaeota archaeon]
MRTIHDLEKNYNLELNEIVRTIKESNPKKVLIQVPDGLKPYATCIVGYLEEKTNANFVIWPGACFGACDLPESDADLVIQFGHAPWE